MDQQPATTIDPAPRRGRPAGHRASRRYEHQAYMKDRAVLLRTERTPQAMRHDERMVPTFLCYTAFPARRQLNPDGSNATLIQRQNGKYRMRIEAEPEYGVPYGKYARIGITAIATLIWRKARSPNWDGSRDIYLGAEFSSLLRLQLGEDVRFSGGNQGNLTLARRQFLRLIHSTIWWWEDSTKRGRPPKPYRIGHHWESGLYDQADLAPENVPDSFAQHKLWIAEKQERRQQRQQLVPEPPPGVEPVDPLDFDLRITVGEAFWEDVVKHSAPYDVGIYRELCHRGGCLAGDIYLWAIYRANAPLARRVGYLPDMRWAQLMTQFGAGYGKNIIDPETDTDTLNSFRKAFRDAFAQVAIFIPSLKLEPKRGGLVRIVTRSTEAKAETAAEAAMAKPLTDFKGGISPQSSAELILTTDAYRSIGITLLQERRLSAAAVAHTRSTTQPLPGQVVLQAWEVLALNLTPDQWSRLNRRSIDLTGQPLDRLFATPQCRSG